MVTFVSSLDGRSGPWVAERKRKSDFRRDVLPLAAGKGDSDLTYTPLLQLKIT